jgi:hypothetical protein
MGSNPIPGSLQINLLFTMYAEQAQGSSPGANFYFFKDKVAASHQHQNLGGAERDRTADPLLAKQVLSQLSYSPIQVAPQGYNQEIRQRLNHKSIQTVQNHQMRSKAQRQIVVGPGRLELPTPRLSSVCSNRLSYGPIRMEQHKATRDIKPQATKAWSLSSEERETWTAICAIPSGSLRSPRRITFSIVT